MKMGKGRFALSDSEKAKRKARRKEKNKEREKHRQSRERANSRRGSKRGSFLEAYGIGDNKAATETKIRE